MYYLGLSIGPIFDTLSRARKTRELWLASYIFSALSKQLTLEIGELANDERYGEGYAQLLAPFGPQNKGPQDLFGAGVFPDRIYVSLKDALPPKKIKDLIRTATAKVAVALIAKTPEDTIMDRARWEVDVIVFFQYYFRVSHVQITERQAEDSGGILPALNAVLETADLEASYLAIPPKPSPLTRLLDKPYTARLARQGLIPNNASTYALLAGKVKDLFEFFPSTADIATLELFQRHSEAYETLRSMAAGSLTEGSDMGGFEIVQDSVPVNTEQAAESGQDRSDTYDDSDSISRFFFLLEQEKGKGERASAIGKHFESYHKYFCIIHADGDGFGKYISTLGSNTQAITRFSQRLGAFAGEAAGIINAYGGKPVYVGGDDLLFFAPVTNRKTTTTQGRTEHTRVTVFDLVEALDQAFAAANIGPGLSLSYGITLTYYKFPLFEARDLSYEQLAYRAKKVKWASGDGVQPTEKNSVAFRLLKHSGSYFEGIVDKPTLEKWNRLRHSLDAKPERLLSSIIFKLRELDSLMVAVHNFKSDRIDNGLKPSFQRLLSEFFNEPIHRLYADQLRELGDFAELIYRNQAKIDGEPLEVDANFYALLRLLAFTISKRSEYGQ